MEEDAKIAREHFISSTAETQSELGELKDKVVELGELEEKTVELQPAKPATMMSNRRRAVTDAILFHDHPLRYGSMLISPWSALIASLIISLGMVYFSLVYAISSARSQTALIRLGFP